jgi:hypothetical protein
MRLINQKKLQSNSSNENGALRITVTYMNKTVFCLGKPSGSSEFI